MRKNKLLVIVLLGYSVIALAGCARREIKNIDAKGTNIVCFGNSITFGYGALPGEDYPSILSKMLGKPIINAGLDADMSVTAITRLDSDVFTRDPLLVIVEFSGNDFLKRIPIETTVKNIGEIVEQIQAKGAMAAIADVSAGLFLQEYRAALSKLAREKSAIFIPGILSGILTSPQLKSDFIHPNANGYKIIAQRIYRAIIPYLNQNTLLKQFQR